MNPKVSLIIPVYRVEQYLPRCLASVEAQTYGNFETILVDDGSPDRCGEMCDAYAATHENVIVIHQQNQGLSAARNNGMKVATGEYFVFIDSDDFVSADYLEYLVNLIIEYNAEISTASVRVFFSKDEPRVAKSESCRVLFNREEALKAMLYGKAFGFSAWGKCYKAGLFSDVEYPVGKAFEDLATTHKLFEKTNRIAFGNKQIYFYRHSNASKSEGKLKQKDFEDGMEAAREVLKDMSDNYPQIAAAAQYRYALKVTQFLKNIAGGRKSDRKYFCILKKEIKPFVRIVLRDPEADNIVKLKTAAMTLGYYPTFILMRCILFAKRFL